jgi:hypothetical protein
LALSAAEWPISVRNLQPKPWQTTMFVGVGGVTENGP